jgi:AcrR family transcriptional regulator
MDAVAKKCGLAKGTLYLYFSTREELLLAVLQEDFTAWFDFFGGFLAQAKQPFGPGFVDAWATGIEAQPRLAMGMAYLHLTLERNISKDFALAWKTFLFEKTKELHYLLMRSFHPAPSLEELGRFLMVMTGTSVGIWMQSQTSDQIRAVFKEHPELRMFEGDFGDHFRLAANALIESRQFAGLRSLKRNPKAKPL